MRKVRTEWKPEHTALMVKLWKAGCSDHVIAGATGHSLETVGQRRRALGLRGNYHVAYSTLDALRLSPQIALTT